MTKKMGWIGRYGSEKRSSSLVEWWVKAGAVVE
jgi:hypothetical protein